MANPAMQRVMGRGQGQPAQLLPYPNPFLGLLPKWAWRRAKDWFTYGLDFTGTNILGAGATLGLTLVINDDADFLAMTQCAVVTSDAETTFYANPPILAFITASGAGRNLSDIPIHMVNYFGSASEPKFLDMSKAFPRSTQILVTLQNLDAVNAYNVRLAWGGFKVFDFNEDGSP